MTEATYQMNIRMPADVKHWLRLRAKENMRSQTSEIVLAVKEKMEREMKNEKSEALA